MDKIICVGKNYVEHAKELNEQQPELPVLFLKPPSVLQQTSRWDSTLIARFPEDLEVVPECELVIEIAKDGEHITEDIAPSFVRNVSVGLDVTLRARQRELKRRGHPWTTAKVFADAALLGPWINVETIPSWQSIAFGMRAANVALQQATANDMIRSPFFLIHFISQFFPLRQGDIIFTGTPAGCKSINQGEKVELFFEKKSFFVEWSA